MVNSIRTPRQGKTDTSRRIAEAVDDEAWQKFRLSLKGKPTQQKLAMLHGYFDGGTHEGMYPKIRGGGRRYHLEYDAWDCDICIRVDNYLKALARGGQLRQGVTLAGMIRDGWSSDWIIR